MSRFSQLDPSVNYQSFELRNRHSNLAAKYEREAANLLRADGGGSMRDLPGTTVRDSSVTSADGVGAAPELRNIDIVPEQLAAIKKETGPDRLLRVTVALPPRQLSSISPSKGRCRMPDEINGNGFEKVDVLLLRLPEGDSTPFVPAEEVDLLRLKIDQKKQYLRDLKKGVFDDNEEQKMKEQIANNNGLQEKYGPRLAETQGELEVACRRVDQLKSQVDALENPQPLDHATRRQLEELQFKIDERRRQTDMLHDEHEDDMRRKAKEFNALQWELDEQRRQARQLEHEMQYLKQTSDTTVDPSTQMQDGAYNASRMMQNVHRLEDKLAETRVRNEALEKRYTAAQTTVDSARDALRITKADLEVEKSKAEQYLREITELRAATDDHAVRLKEKIDELTRRQAELDRNTMDSNASAADAEIQNLRAKNKLLMVERDQAFAKSRELAFKRTQQLRKVTELKTHMDELEAEQTKLMRDNALLQREITVISGMP